MAAVNGIEVATPHLDKQNEIIKSGKAQVIQDFIEWLAEELIAYDGGGEPTITVPTVRIRCTYVCRRFSSRNGPRNSLGDQCVDGEILDHDGLVTCTWCIQCKGTGWRPGSRNASLYSERDVEAIMARYFDIDLLACEDERRALLAALRG